MVVFLFGVTISFGVRDLRWRFGSLRRKWIQAVFESAAKRESVTNMASVATLSCIALSILPHSRHQMHYQDSALTRALQIVSLPAWNP